MGDSLRWCGEHTLIYREERPVEWGVQPITWGNQQNWAPYGGGGDSPPRTSQSTLHPLTMGKPVFWICYETLAIIMFGIFGFDIDKKFSFNHYLLFKLSFTGL